MQKSMFLINGGKKKENKCICEQCKLGKRTKLGLFRAFDSGFVTSKGRHHPSAARGGAGGGASKTRQPPAAAPSPRRGGGTNGLVTLLVRCDHGGGDGRLGIQFDDSLVLTGANANATAHGLCTGMRIVGGGNAVLTPGALAQLVRSNAGGTDHIVLHVEDKGGAGQPLRTLLVWCDDEGHLGVQLDDDLRILRANANAREHGLRPGQRIVGGGTAITTPEAVATLAAEGAGQSRHVVLHLEGGLQQRRRRHRRPINRPRARAPTTERPGTRI